MEKRTMIIGLSLLILTIVSIDYGWRLFGFNACTTGFPSVTEVKVNDDVLKIKGTTFYSGDHYIGYMREVKDETLYLGIRYQLFTVFHKGGNFNIEIPLKDVDLKEVYIKGRDSRELIWERK
ncbi:MAG TPA: hypothetical protein VJ962_01505 [Clostridia bacterium]|nr:hypothetical protein [Clostridia bacterium]